MPSYTVSQSCGVSVAKPPSPLGLISLQLVHVFIRSLCTARLTFVMSIQASSIVDNGQVGINIRRRVTGPDVTVNETRLNLAASSFQWAEQARNDLVKNALAKLLHFLIDALRIFFGMYEPLERMMEGFFPRVVPLRVLGNRTLVSWHIESVFAVW